MKRTIAYIDGACAGNPGKSGIGVAVYDDSGTLMSEISHYLGEATNNIAEYQALITALEKARELGCERLIVYTDSELLARQINGFYKVRNKGLKPLFLKAKSLMRYFSDTRIRHIGRDKNKQADRLARQAVERSKG